jgi:hypothetical protein
MRGSLLIRVDYGDELIENSVKAVFVDTDGMSALDSKIGDLVQNVTEAELVYQVRPSCSMSFLADDIRNHSAVSGTGQLWTEPIRLGSDHTISTTDQTSQWPL